MSDSEIEKLLQKTFDELNKKIAKIIAQREKKAKTEAVKECKTECSKVVQKKRKSKLSVSESDESSSE